MSVPRSYYTLCAFRGKMSIFYKKHILLQLLDNKGVMELNRENLYFFLKNDIIVPYGTKNLEESLSLQTDMDGLRALQRRGWYGRSRAFSRNT